MTKRALSSQELIEEAARRDMSVMDAAEAARLRGVDEAEMWHHAYDVDKAFRGRVAALADEWERTRAVLFAGGVGEGMLSFRDAAARLRALLAADDEPEVSA